MMHQALLGLAALMGVMFFSYHQQRALLQSQMQKIRQLSQHQAQAEATEVLDRLGGRAFDPNAPVSSVSSLTIEDVEGVHSVNDAASITDSTVVTSDSLVLTMNGEVRFVESSGGSFTDSGGSKTYYKEVTIEVTSGMEGVFPVEVRLSRVYSYTPVP